MINRLALIFLVLVGCRSVRAGQAQLIASEGDVFALRTQVIAGDTAAMHQLLNLKVDGVVSEDVEVVMGEAIKQHPTSSCEKSRVIVEVIAPAACPS
jgi:hypothetical protein